VPNNVSTLLDNTPSDHLDSLSIGISKTRLVEMEVWYLAVAVMLTVMLNAKTRWLRASGTFIAAFCLAMIVLSIVLAHLDGTFAAIEPDAPLIRRWTPAMLSIQAAVASAAAMFLCWAAWKQALRPVVSQLAPQNSPTSYGAVSRGFHWVTAILMLSLVPIGLFVTALSAAHPERAGFVAAHQSLGLTVLILVAARVVWLCASPAPVAEAYTAEWRRRAARAVHIVFYALLFAFPLTGYVVSAANPEPIVLYGVAVPVIKQPSEIVAATAGFAHTWVLPVLFYSAVALHLAAVGERHFIDGRNAAIRRMVR
jgi:cytochrome b561